MVVAASQLAATTVATTHQHSAQPRGAARGAHQPLSHPHGRAGGSEATPPAKQRSEAGEAELLAAASGAPLPCIEFGVKSSSIKKYYRMRFLHFLGFLLVENDGSAVFWGGRSLSAPPPILFLLKKVCVSPSKLVVPSPVPQTIMLLGGAPNKQSLVVVLFALYFDDSILTKQAIYSLFLVRRLPSC